MGITTSVLGKGKQRMHTNGLWQQLKFYGDSEGIILCIDVPASGCGWRLSGRLTNHPLFPPRTLAAAGAGGPARAPLLGGDDSSYTGASLAAVSGLTALTRLVLHRVDICPPTYALAKLAGTLRVLQVHSVVEDSVVLNSTVQALPGLETRALDLGYNQMIEIELEAAAMQLPHLRCLCISAYHSMSGRPGTGDLPRNLPAGPYLSSLQRLALPMPLAVAAHALLAQAPQLHTLCLQLPDSGQDYPRDNWQGFWQFVTSNPPLRRLLYEVHSFTFPCNVCLLDALLLLSKQRPALEVRRLEMAVDRVHNPPTCWSELLDAKVLQAPGSPYSVFPIPLHLDALPCLSNL